MGGDVAGDGLCCGLFDNIGDLVDFFIEEEDVLIDNKMDSTPALAEPLFAPPVEDGISCKTSVGASLKHEGLLDKPGNGNGNEDNEWWLKFFEDNTDSFSLNFDDSSSRANTTNAIVGAQEDSLFHTSSPLSVLEHNSDSSGDGSDSSSSFSSSNSEGNSKDSTLASEPILVVPARARSKRPRPTTFSLRPHVTVPYLPPSTDAQQNSQFTSSELESSITDSDSRKKMKKRKKASFISTVTSGEMDAEMSERLQVQPSRTRKCMHCGIEKTPQWRAGPLGPKTLCNACGVRYKSGRLFPEYRPAASPTFVPSLHSNSHKKVVEMRIKADQSPSQGGCDLKASCLNPSVFFASNFSDQSLYML